MSNDAQGNAAEPSDPDVIPEQERSACHWLKWQSPCYWQVAGITVLGPLKL